MEHNEVKEEVLEFIQRMNRLWTVHNNPDALVDYFHADMVAITPVDRLRREGREACVDGWRDFCMAVKILSWKENDVRVNVFGEGQFAVLSYYYEMTYEMNGQKYESLGRDLFSLVKENGRWWVVSDQFSSFP